MKIYYSCFVLCSNEKIASVQNNAFNILKLKV